MTLLSLEGGEEKDCLVDDDDDDGDDDDEGDVGCGVGGGGGGGKNGEDSRGEDREDRGGGGGGEVKGNKDPLGLLGADLLFKFLLGDGDRSLTSASTSTSVIGCCLEFSSLFGWEKTAVVVVDDDDDDDDDEEEDEEEDDDEGDDIDTPCT
jgi:hypothetical protein